MDGALTTARLAAALSLRTFCAMANRLRQAGRCCAAPEAAMDSREGAVAPVGGPNVTRSPQLSPNSNGRFATLAQALPMCSSSVAADEILHTPGEASTFTIATRAFSTSMAYRDDRP